MNMKYNDLFEEKDYCSKIAVKGPYKAIIG